MSDVVETPGASTHGLYLSAEIRVRNSFEEGGRWSATNKQNNNDSNKDSATICEPSGLFVSPGTGRGPRRPAMALHNIAELYAN